MDPTRQNFESEENALRAMLGQPAEPVYLDIKPGPLSNRERELFQRRLGIVREELAAYSLNCD